MNSANRWILRVVLPLLISVLFHLALRRLGNAANAIIFARSSSEWMVDAALSSLCYVGVAIGVWAWTRWCREAAGVLLFWLLILGYFGVGYSLSLRGGHQAQEWAYFGDVITGPASQSLTESTPHVPTTTYKHDAHGLRYDGQEDNESSARHPGLVRGAIIGDSFVFGYGVQWKDTLGEQLEQVLATRRPGVHFDIRNLGISGINMPTFLMLYREAIERLELDFVLLCISLPNDLQSWDARNAWMDIPEPGILSLSEFLLGPNNGYTILTMFMDTRMLNNLPLARSLLQEQLNNLQALSAEAPPTFLFAYFAPDPSTEQDLIQRLGTRFVRPVSMRNDYLIPIDGHPNPRGNRRFAEAIADTLLQDKDLMRAMDRSGAPDPKLQDKN